MSLTLITGRAVAGKTGALHAELVAALHRGRRVALLLPAFADVRRARVDLSGRAPVGLRVDTLDAWAAGLWALYGSGEALVTDASRQALVAEAVSDHERANPVASTLGYRRILVSLVARAAGFDLASTDGEIERGVWADVRRYRVICANNGLIEPSEAARKLAAKCPVQDMVIGINRFTDLSPAQEALIGALSAANEVYLALNFARGFAPTEAALKLVERLTANGAAERELASPHPDTELRCLEARIFDPTTVHMQPSGAVELMEAAGDEAECAIIADRVARLVSEGSRPHDIVVAFRDVARRQHLLRAALESRGLRCEIDIAVPFEKTALGRTFGALTAVAKGNGGREALMDFLLSPYSGVGATEAQYFDAWTRKHRIESASELMRGVSRNLPAAGDELVRPLQDALRGELDSHAARAWKRVADLLVRNGSAADGRAESELVLDGAAHNLIVRAADELASMQSNRPPSSSLTDYLIGAKVHSGGEERDGAVYVTEAERLRSRRFKVVVIGGLTADEFSSEKREPLVVQLLQRLGLPAGTEERLSERLLFYSVATRARERLILVRQASTSTGSALRPSAFWDEVRDVYRSPRQVELNEEPSLSVGDSLPLSALEVAAPAYDPERRALRNRVAKGLLRAAEAPRGRIDRTPWSDESREFSVTELETYHACPYRWFYDRMIRPRELDGAFGAKERGALVHDALAEFYAALPGVVGARVTPTLLPAALTLLDEIWDQAVSRGDRLTRGLSEELALAAGRDWARRVVADDASILDGFVPMEHEWRFGREADCPFQVGSVPIKGSIDRLDIADGAVVVTDYKSSSSVEGSAAFEKRGLFQIIVYSEVAREQLGRDVAGAFYRSLPTGQLRGFWNSGTRPAEPWVHDDDVVGAKEQEVLVSWARRAVEEAAEGIRSAFIAPRPRFPIACSWCGARSFCEERRR